MTGLEKTITILQRELEKMRKERAALDAALLRVEDALRLVEAEDAPQLTVAFRRKPVWTPAARRAARQRAKARWALVRRVGGRTLADIPPPTTRPEPRSRR